MRVLNLWQKNGVFKIEIIQPLLAKATGSASGTSSFLSMDDPGKWFGIALMSVYTLDVF